MLEYKKVQHLLSFGGNMSLKLAVIGAGPAGYPAALAAARLGAEVTVFEKDQLGGVCLNCGCIPSKSLLDAAHRFDAVRDMARFCQDGAEMQARTLLQQISWPKIQARQQAVTRKLTGGIGVLFKQAKINVVPAATSFKDAHTLTARTSEGVKDFSFDYILIAAGTTAFVPPPFDKIRDKIYDNSNIFLIPRLPQKLAIIGGGVIGCEFAALMSSLNVKVSVVEMQPRLLPNMEESLSRLLSQKLQKKGISLLTGKQASAVRLDGDKKIISLSDGTELEADDILVAIGRSCDLTDLRPENAGLSWNRKGLQGVNPQTLQVKNHIYAAGDVTGLSLLAHAASRQGEVAAHNICGQPQTYNNDLIPSAVYTSPELAGVGLTRTQAQQRGLDVKVQKAFMLANGRALTQDATEGFVEIVSDAQNGKLLGVCLAAPNASEIISLFTVALEAGLTVAQLRNVVFPHPTVSEVVADALAR